MVLVRNTGGFHDYNYCPSLGKKPTIDFRFNSGSKNSELMRNKKIKQPFKETKKKIQILLEAAEAEKKRLERDCTALDDALRRSTREVSELKSTIEKIEKLNRSLMEQNYKLKEKNKRLGEYNRFDIMELEDEK